MTSRSRQIFTSGLLLCASIVSTGAAATTFNNATPITINDNVPASVYPSNITVSGLTGNITAVNVILHGFSHTFAGDLNLLLVAPGGQKIALSQSAGGGKDLNNATITFSNSTAANFNSASNPIPSGVYHPLSSFPTNSYAPAPAGPYSTDLTTLNGPVASQLGTWSLYVSDHAGLDVGAITGGWSLVINPFTTCAAEGFGGGKQTLCHQICEVSHPAATTNALIKAWVAAYHSNPPCI